MKLTESSLRSMVKQELQKVLKESSFGSLEYSKAANNAYVKSYHEWKRLTTEENYQPKMEFSDAYQKYLEEKVYPFDYKVTPSMEEFINFCSSKGFLINQK